MTRDEVHALLMAFRGVEAAVSYGHPSYKVREKFFTWFWPETPDCLVVQLDSREQRDMLADPLLSHPAYWAPFLLIGNWR